MSHARQQIREAFATALTGLATTASRVHQSRMLPGDALPALLISSDSERITQSPQNMQTRELVLTVRGLAKMTGAIDDTLDTIAGEVETAAKNAGTLSGKVASGLVLETIDIEFDDTLEKPAGVVVLQFRGTYFTNAGTPGSII